MPQRVAESSIPGPLVRRPSVGPQATPGAAASRQSPAASGDESAVSTAASFLEQAKANASGQPASGDRALRVLDVIGSIVGLFVLSPIMVIAAVAIGLGSRGSVFYRQERIGRWGEPFIVLKLRTMGPGAEEDLAAMLSDPHFEAQWSETRKIADDPRITRIGRILRAADLDELPQLWNVLRGEMSLVGPRPVPAEEAERYGDALTDVLSVRPGLTGLWQVSGRNTVSYDRRIELDLEYVEDRSIPFNLQLMIKTVAQLVFRRGLPKA